MTSLSCLRTPNASGAASRHDLLIHEFIRNINYAAVHFWELKIKPVRICQMMNTNPNSMLSEKVNAARNKVILV